jgi:hypothetical protein
MGGFGSSGDSTISVEWWDEENEEDFNSVSDARERLYALIMKSMRFEGCARIFNRKQQQQSNHDHDHDHGQEGQDAKTYENILLKQQGLKKRLSQWHRNLQSLDEDQSLTNRSNTSGSETLGTEITISKNTISTLQMLYSMITIMISTCLNINLTDPSNNNNRRKTSSQEIIYSSPEYIHHFQRIIYHAPSALSLTQASIPRSTTIPRISSTSSPSLPIPSNKSGSTSPTAPPPPPPPAVAAVAAAQRERQRLPFIFDLGPGLPLFWTALKCRIPEIRYQALAFLRQTPSVQGLFRCKQYLEIGEMVVRLEEGVGGIESIGDYSEGEHGEAGRHASRQDNEYSISEYGCSDGLDSLENAWASAEKWWDSAEHNLFSEGKCLEKSGQQVEKRCYVQCQQDENGSWYLREDGLAC